MCRELVNDQQTRDVTGFTSSVPFSLCTANKTSVWGLGLGHEGRGTVSGRIGVMYGRGSK